MLLNVSCMSDMSHSFTIPTPLEYLNEFWLLHIFCFFSSTVLKKRLVKLVVNFLFYFRTDEAEVTVTVCSCSQGWMGVSGF